MPIAFKKPSKDQGAPQGSVCQKNPHLDNVKFTLFSIYIKFMKQKLGSAGSIRMSTCDLSMWRWHCHRAVAIGSKTELCSEKKVEVLWPFMTQNWKLCHIIFIVKAGTSLLTSRWSWLGAGWGTQTSPLNKKCTRIFLAKFLNSHIFSFNNSSFLSHKICTVSFQCKQMSHANIATGSSLLPRNLKAKLDPGIEGLLRSFPLLHLLFI